MARAGRKCKPYPRTPSGRISEAKTVIDRRAAETEAEATDTAITARVRMFGVSREEAKQPTMGSVVGRMLRERVIRRDQHEAADRYFKALLRHQIAIGAVPAAREPRDEASSGGGDDPEAAHQAFCVSARAEWHRVEAVVNRVTQEERSLAPKAALDLIVVQGIHDHRLVGPLRVVLNALGRLWHLEVVRGEASA